MIGAYVDKELSGRFEEKRSRRSEGRDGQARRGAASWRGRCLSFCVGEQIYLR